MIIVYPAYLNLASKGKAAQYDSDEIADGLNENCRNPER